MLRAALFLAAGALLGLGNFVYPYLSARDALLGWTLALALPLAAGIAWAATRARAAPLPAAWLVPGSLLAALAVAWAAESWWPNSADEYGYVFLARTLLHGRLWNPAPPAPEIYEIAWTYVRDGKWFSQYPPAWPALLAPFLLVHAAWLLNPLLTAMLCGLMLAALRLLHAGETMAVSLTVLLVASPFVLFNGASLFPHTLTAVLILGIVGLQLREQVRRVALHRAGIGALFGVLLLTRYDVFVLAAAPFLIDALWFRRAALLRDAPAYVLGGLPFAAAFTAYNQALTGHLLKTPYAWASGGAHIGLWGKHVVLSQSLAEAGLRTAHWAGELAAFTSPLLMLLAGLAIAAKLRAGRLRWYNSLMPLAVVFFFLYPATGGHEFGPRYWFFAWPTAMLTIATGLGTPDGWLAAGRWRLHVASLAAAQLPAFLGMAASTALFTHLYVDQRRQVEGVQPPSAPSLVLIPTRALMLSRWQGVPIVAHSADFCRNGVEASGPVLYGRADNNFQHADQFAGAACAFAGRTVYLWRAPGVFDRVPCR